MDRTTKNTSDTAPWPNSIISNHELDSSLEDGERSGVSTKTIDSVFEDVISDIENG